MTDIPFTTILLVAIESFSLLYSNNPSDELYIESAKGLERGSINPRDVNTKDMCTMSHAELEAAYKAGFEYSVPLPCAKILKAVKTKEILLYNRIARNFTFISAFSVAGFLMLALNYFIERRNYS